MYALLFARTRSCRRIRRWYPCFIVTESLKNVIVFNGLTGVKFKNIAMTFSDEFYDICGNIKVPKFVQIICNELSENHVENLKNDFYILDKNKDIIVSEKALNILTGDGYMRVVFSRLREIRLRLRYKCLILQCFRFPTKNIGEIN